MGIWWGGGFFVWRGLDFDFRCVLDGKKVFNVLVLFVVGSF